MAKTLYFANAEQRTCWPVPNCIADPELFAVARKSPPYRNNHITVAESTTPAGQNLVIGHTAKISYPGALNEVRTKTETLGTGQLENGLEVVDGALNDEASGADLRQSSLEYTHWKVLITVEADSPTYCLVAIDQYPDGFSTRPPSWWVDPDAV